MIKEKNYVKLLLCCVIFVQQKPFQINTHMSVIVINDFKVSERSKVGLDVSLSSVLYSAGAENGQFGEVI